jgi:tetratricopeptide (TPR) repeat protein
VRFLYEIQEYDRALDVLDEADMYTYSTELLYYKVLVLMAVDENEEAFEVLKEALSEDFEGHYFMFARNPKLVDDQEFLSIIHYFIPEE